MDEKSLPAAPPASRRRLFFCGNVRVVNRRIRIEDDSRVAMLMVASDPLVALRSTVLGGIRGLPSSIGRTIFVCARFLTDRCTGSDTRAASSSPRGRPLSNSVGKAFILPLPSSFGRPLRSFGSCVW